MELLDERWTILIVRELVLGSRRFNDLRRGLPRISPTLLSKRLRQLTAAGLVTRVDDDGEAYQLTDAGQELRPIVEAIGVWGTRWIGELGDRDLDPKLLLWDMHRNIEHARLPDGRSVVEFEFSDVPSTQRRWWLVLTAQEADVCDEDPGYPVGVRVQTTLRRLIQIWRGDKQWAASLKEGAVEVQGPRALCRAVPEWFKWSPFAGVPRPAARL
jgi:DNA-binding HxlR family transcriptional regulator